MAGAQIPIIDDAVDEITSRTAIQVLPPEKRAPIRAAIREQLEKAVAVALLNELMKVKGAQFLKQALMLQNPPKVLNELMEILPTSHDVVQAAVRSYIRAYLAGFARAMNGE